MLMNISFSVVLLNTTFFNSEVVIVGEERQCGKCSSELFLLSLMAKHMSCVHEFEQSTAKQGTVLSVENFLFLFELGVIFSASIWCL